MSKRLTRHLLTLAMPAASEHVMKSICTAVLGGFMDTYFTPGQISQPLLCLVHSWVVVVSYAFEFMLCWVHLIQWRCVG